MPKNRTPACVLSYDMSLKRDGEVPMVSIVVEVPLMTDKDKYTINWSGGQTVRWSDFVLNPTLSVAVPASGCGLLEVLVPYSVKTGKAEARVVWHQSGGATLTVKAEAQDDPGWQSEVSRQLGELRREENELPPGAGGGSEEEPPDRRFPDTMKGVRAILQRLNALDARDAAEAKRSAAAEAAPDPSRGADEEGWWKGDEELGPPSAGQGGGSRRKKIKSKKTKKRKSRKTKKRKSRKTKNGKSRKTKKRKSRKIKR